MDERFAVFSGRGNPELSKKISVYLKSPLGNIKITNFKDGEIYCQILENVRGRDVFIIQPLCPPVNDNMMELLVMLDAFKRSSASRVTAVIPYYGYARQDRKDKPRVPISARLVADLITAAGASRVLCMDVHAAQIQGFFNIPVDHLFAAPVLVKHIESMDLNNLTIVSPDAGGVERARAYAKRLKASLVIVDKRREEANVAEVMNVIGDVKDRSCVVVDDMIDTAGSLCKTADALKDKGAREIFAACTHPILSDNAMDRITESEIKMIFVTDTIPLSPEKANNPKISTFTVSDLLGEAIVRIHKETSVSSLFV